MNKEELTPRQQFVYETIKNFIENNGYAPSVRELCNLCCVSSSATMWVHLQKIKQKGYIDFINKKSRTIRIIKE